MLSAEEISAFTCRLQYEDVPAAVLADVKLRFLDTLGVCLLSSQLDFARPFVSLVQEQGGRPEASLIGTGDRVPANQAALVNGSLAHGAEYDDTDASSGIHPSCFVVTSALSMAERQGANGKAMLVAATAGYEIALRLGRSGMNHHSAFHPTAISGTFATTVVAGRLLGLNDQQLASALGIAGSQAAGSWKFLEDGSGVKRLHGGWPGHCGITAALLAERGLTGPHAIFDGPRGTLASYGSSGADPAGLLDGLGRVWLTPGTTYKVYPCCSLCQAAMDAARALQRQHEFSPDDLARVDCFVSEEAFGIVCEPRQDKLHPSTPYQAAFSLPMCVAIALLDQTVSVDSFHEARLADVRTLGLAERIVGVSDSGLEVADGQPARVVVRLHDGRRFERAATLRGTSQNPFTATEIEAKFRANAGRALPTDQLTAAIDCLRDLELVHDVRELTTLLAAPPAQVRS